MKRKIIVLTIMSISLIVGVVCLDYINLFSSLGIYTNSLNWDMLSILLSNTVVIILFLITYFLIDSRNIQREKNQQITAYIILKGIYERCSVLVELFGDEKTRYTAVHHCDGNALLFDDKAHMHYLNYPFENEPTIFDFVSSGVVSKRLFSEYFEIKSEYQKYINNAIIFFDHYDQILFLESSISERLNNATATLQNAIQHEIEII